MFLNAFFVFIICINSLDITKGHLYQYDPNVDIRNYLKVVRINDEPDTQPAAEEVKTGYISPYNISEVAIYEPIGPTATVSPSSSSFRAFEDYTFYNSYPNYLNRGKGDAEAVLRGYTCWDTYTAKLKSNQCKASCKYAYTSVCQQRQCPKPMVSRAVKLCIYLCAAEFE
ncbi:uncharacterized protein LOC113233673 [Hyposmocoma kahamanoa]|uniref:uncharacterized protein LOC113233673 n=1 Tax=Hyposmocoma kahamanoa TaxID=1477025 RepID=UPI000E6D8C60|nr:uncharacterized protein LOC113233673 [Hyposmocoma kahamanoa]